MRAVVRSDAAPARGAYSPAVLVGDLLFTSGQTGRDPATGELPQQLDAQVRQALDRLSALCQAAGTSLQHAIRATVYLTDLKVAGTTLDAAFTSAFGEQPPARTTVGVPELPGGALVEIDLIVAVHPTNSL
jgi:2-iminobutanoate/2-iminopropanoate deaminase